MEKDMNLDELLEKLPKWFFDYNEAAINYYEQWQNKELEVKNEEAKQYLLIKGKEPNLTVNEVQAKVIQAVATLKAEALKLEAIYKHALNKVESCDKQIMLTCKLADREDRKAALGLSGGTLEKKNIHTPDTRQPAETPPKENEPEEETATIEITGVKSETSKGGNPYWKMEESEGKTFNVLKKKVPIVKINSVYDITYKTLTTDTGGHTRWINSMKEVKSNG